MIRSIPCALVASGALLASGVLLASGAASAEESPAQESGTWQKHQYSFVFMGFTTTYSCDGLATKLKLLLTAVGARGDSKARSGACPSGYGRPDKFARADLTFYTLLPAAPDQSTDGPLVKGSWRPVVIAARSPRDLSVGDCELVEQFKNAVLPSFSTRYLDTQITCIPHQNSGSNFSLKLESFTVTAPKKVN